MTTRTALAEQLDNLEAAIPAMTIEYPDRMDLLIAIAGEADLIEDRALAADDARYVSRRVDLILARAGLVE